MHSMLTQTTIYKLDLRDDPFCTHPKNIYSVIKYFLPPDTHLCVSGVRGAAFTEHFAYAVNGYVLNV